MNENVNKLKYAALDATRAELPGKVGAVLDFGNPAHLLFSERIVLSYDKFAELLIKECARIAAVHSEEGVEFNGGDGILEYFGIDK